MRNLRKLGESTFATWCAHEGIVCNGSEIDMAGWDFFLEIPFPAGPFNRPLHAANISCKIQVKSTDGRNRKWDVTLSNLKFLATGTLPAFFVFIEFDGGFTPQRAFLVHLDHALISKILERLFKEEVAEGNLHINKKKMSITYGKEHEIDIQNGPSLRAEIESHVGDMHSYVEQKKRHLLTTGFKRGIGRISFTASGEENLNALIDASIGLKEFVRIDELTGYETRFGMQSKKPNLSIKSGTLSMTNISATAFGVFSIYEESLPSPIKFKCKLFVPPFLSNLPSRLWKCRIVGENFDLTFSLTPGQASASIDLADVRLSTHDMRDHLNLMKLIFSSGKSIRAEFITNDGEKLLFTINSGGNSFNLEEELEALKNAITALKNFDHLSKVEVTLRELYYQRHEINSFAFAISNIKLANLSYTVEEDSFDINAPVTCLAVMLSRVGQHKLGILLKFDADSSISANDRYKMVDPKVSIAKIFSFDPGENVDHEMVENYIAIERGKLEESNQVVQMAGFYRGSAPDLTS